MRRGPKKKERGCAECQNGGVAGTAPTHRLFQVGVSEEEAQGERPWNDAEKMREKQRAFTLLTWRHP